MTDTDKGDTLVQEAFQRARGHCRTVGAMFHFTVLGGAIVTLLMSDGVARIVAVGGWVIATLITARAWRNLSLQIATTEAMYAAGKAQLALQKKTVEEWIAHWESHPECKEPPPPSTYM